MPTKQQVADMIRHLETGKPLTDDDEAALIGMLSELFATLTDDPEAA